MTAATIAQNIFDGATGTDATILTNKLIVAKAYTASINTASEVVAYSGTVAAASARALLTTVDAATVTASFDVATSVASIVSSAATAAAASGGKTFILTTARDVKTGSTEADTFFAVVDTVTTTNTTLSSFDTVDGGLGSDTMNVTLTTADFDGSPTIKSIEKFIVKTDANKDFNANGLTGVESVTSNRSTNILEVINIGAASTVVGMSNITNVAATLTGSYADVALAGTDDTVTINLAGGVGASTSAATDNEILITSTASTNGAENLTVNVTGGKAYIGTLESEEKSGLSQVLKKLTVTGDSDLKIVAALDYAGTTATLDASAATGGVTAILDVNVTNMTVTGGSGADSFDMVGGLNTTDVIDGGAGVDTVKLKADTTTLSTMSITNVETIVATASANNANLVVNATGQAGLATLVLEENGDAGADNENLTSTDLAAGVAVEVRLTNTASAVGTVSLGLSDASGTADELNLTVAGTSGFTSADNTIASLAFTNIETLNLTSGHVGSTAMLTDGTDVNTITAITSDTTLTKITATGSDELLFKLSGAETNLATIDASGMTDNVTVDVGTNALASAVTITTGSEDDTITMGATLTNADTIDGGSNSVDAQPEDTLSGTVTSLTATTGALNISNVERVQLTNAGTTIIDATAITGATEISFVSTTKTTVTGLAAGTAVGSGTFGAGADGDAQMAAETATYVLSLADETGAADTLTFNLNNTHDSRVNTLTLQANAAVETFALVVNNDVDVDMSASDLTVSGLNIANITVSGAKLATGNVFDLNTLDTDTKTVDASGFNGILTALAGSATAMTFTTKSGAAHNLTGSSANDVFTITGGTANAAYILDGNGGTDTLTLAVANGAVDLDGVQDIDTVGLSMAASAAATFGVDANTSDGLNGAATVNITGGNAISTLTVGVTPTGNYGSANATINADGTFGGLTAATTTKFDASAFNGKLTNVVFTSNGLDNSVTVIGSPQADKVTALYAAGQTIKSMTGIETFEINLTGAAAIDMKNVDDVTKVMMDDDGTARVLTLTDLDAGVAVEVETGVTASGLVVDLIDSSSATDALNVTFKTTNAASNVFTIDSGSANNIETLNLTMTVGQNVDLTGFTMDTAGLKSTVNISGAGATILSAVDTDITTIDASATTGGVTMTNRTSIAANTLKGGTGVDTFIMKHGNDVITGGSGADVLNISLAAVLGGLSVDLSSTTDQITTFNGSSNSAVQTGFTSVDASGYTGSFGAQLTANKAGSTITGTDNLDVLTGGAGADIFHMKTATAIDDIDNVAGGAGANSLVFDVATTAIDDADFASMTLVQTATLANGTNTAVFGANAATAGFVTINGGTGADAVTMGAGDHTFTGNGGTDVVQGGAGADTITFAAGVAVVKAKYVAGDSADYASPGSATFVTTVGMDIVTGMNAGDDLILPGYTGIANSTGNDAVLDTDAHAGSDLSAMTLVANSIHALRGTYSSAADTFTESGTGVDMLFVYDGNVIQASTDFEAVVIVGAGALGFDAEAGTGGVVGLS